MQETTKIGKRNRLSQITDVFVHALSWVMLIRIVRSHAIRFMVRTSAIALMAIYAAGIGHATIVPIPIDDDLNIYIPCTDISGNTETGNVTLTVSPGGPTTTSDASGNYKILCVPVGNQVVTPTKAGSTFLPASLLVSVPTPEDTVITNINFKWARTIKGNVGISGATVTLKNGTIVVATVVSDLSGNYSITGVGPGAYDLSVAKVDAVFSAPSRTITVAGADLTSESFALVSATVAGVMPGDFSISPSGAAKYIVPIQVPPGTAGMQPKLALAYNSQHGNGIAGVGWQLAGLSTVSYCPTTLLRDSAISAEGNFCLDGQRLVVISSATGTTEYRTATDSFSKITQDAAGFHVFTKSGQIIDYVPLFYHPVQCYPSPGKACPAVVPPAQPKYWAITKISDRHGNYLTVSYLGNPSEYYVDRIDYTGNTSAAVNPFNSVQFDYNVSRPDPEVSFIRGSRTESARLLTGIRTFSGAALVKNYRLQYESALSTSTKRSRLQSVTECDSANICLPPTTMIYQGNTIAYSSIGSVSAGLSDGSGYDKPNRLFQIDINGDGKSDIIARDSATGSLTTWLSNGTTFTSSGTTATPYTDAYVGTTGTATIERFFVADVNGDGRGDLVFRETSGALTTWLSNSQTNYTTFINSGQTNTGLNSSGWAGIGHFFAMDVNGDGRTDIVSRDPSSGTLIAWLSNGATFTTSGTNTTTTLTDAAGYNATARVSQADFNGDGMVDLLARDSVGTLRIWRSNGKSFDSGGNAATNLTDASIGSGNQRMFLMDINGDGKTDLVMRDSAGTFAIRLSDGFGLAGATYSAASSFTDAGGWSGADRFFKMDVNDDGRGDLVARATNGSLTFLISNSTGFISAANQTSSYTDTFVGGKAGRFFVTGATGDGRSALVVRDSAGTLSTFAPSGPKPDLLQTVTNGLGAYTSVTYFPLTNASIYTKGNSSTWPILDVQSPQYVVTFTSESTGLLNTRRLKNYNYGGMKVNLLSRMPMGFQTMTSTDQSTGISATATFYQNDVCSTTLANGNTDYLCVGMQASSRRFKGTVELGKSRVITPAFVSTYPGVYFSYSSVHEETHHIANDGVTASTLINTVTTTTVFGESPQYGNPTKITVSDTAGFTKVTDNVFNNDAANWLVGQLMASAVTSTDPTSGTATRVSSFTYYSVTGRLNTETLEPCPRPAIPGVIIPTPCDAKLTLTSTYGYDAFGNRNTAMITGGRSGFPDYVAPRTTTVTFEPKGRYPSEIKNALNQTETRTYDDRFGEMQTLVGPNNLPPTIWTYDGLGRKTTEARPDGTRSTFVYSRCSCVLSPKHPYQYQVTTSSTGMPDQIEYIDELSRKIATKTTAYDGSNFIVNALEYDALGRITRVSRPNFGAISSLGTSTLYDILNRPTKETRPDGSTTDYSYVGLETSETKSTGRAGVTSIVNKQIRNAHGQLVTAINASNVPSDTSQIKYKYDPFGNLLSTTDQNNVVTSSIQYNIRGFKTGMTDKDMGTWSYEYDALGQLIKQTDAKLQVTNIIYDLLGRVTDRGEPTLVSKWSYDKYADGSACAKGTGKLCEVSTDNQFRRVLTYDSLGRPNSSTTYFGATQYTTNIGYDNCANGLGKVCSITYPSTFGANARFSVKNFYNFTGYLTAVLDVNGASLWSLAASGGMNADGNITKETLGNGLVTDRLYTPETGRIDTIKTDSGLVQNSDFDFDHLGDLVSRKDLLMTVNEAFTYDALNRVKNVTMTGAFSLTKSYGYDSVGNLNSKSDVGSLNYGAVGAFPYHAVKTVTGNVDGAVNPTYNYDPNGSMTQEMVGPAVQRAISYNGFNMPFTITKGTKINEFLYDADHARVREIRKTGATVDSTTYFVNEGNSLFFEVETKGTVTEYKHYVHAPSGLLMMRTVATNASVPSDRYFHKDHLGSIVAITDHAKNVVERNSYDIWGKRRNNNGSDAATAPSSLTRRGFTQHEMLPEVGMIHMNGRVYEATLGRFVSADPHVQFATSSQSFNRYTYVQNNPLSLIDPTGYEFESGFDGAGDANYGGDFGGGYGGGDFGGSYGGGYGGGDYGGSSSGIPQLETEIVTGQFPGTIYDYEGVGDFDRGGFAVGENLPYNPFVSVNGDLGGSGFSSVSIADNNLGFSGGYGERFGGAGTTLASADIALPMPGSGIDASDAFRALGRLVVGAGLMAHSKETARDDDRFPAYHGTSKPNAALLLTSGLSVVSAAANKHNYGSDHELGFYMTPSLSLASKFAEEEYPHDAIVRYDFTSVALTILERAGMRSSEFSYNREFGIQWFVPPSAFGIFNGLVADGEINVSIMK